MKDRFGVFLGFVVAVTVGVAFGVEGLNRGGCQNDNTIRSLIRLRLTHLRKVVLLLG